MNIGQTVDWRNMLRSPLALPIATAAFVSIAVTSVVAIGLSEGSLQYWDEYNTLLRARSFTESRDWSTITVNHHPSFRKPPLQYMMIAALLGADVGGVLALRFWTLVFALALLPCVAVLAYEVSGRRPWAIASSVLLLAGSGAFWRHARTGLLDHGQSLFVVAALLFTVIAMRRPGSWIAAGIAIGLGFLQKSPAALIAVAFWIAAQWVLDRDGRSDWRRRLQCREFRIGAVIALSLCLVWPAIQVARFGGEFLDVFFFREMVDRFTPTSGIRAGNPTPSRLHWLVWLGRFGAQIWWPAFAATVLVVAWPRFRSLPALRGIAWFVLAFGLALTFAGGRTYPRYLITVLPLLAVVAGSALAQSETRPWLGTLTCGLLFATGIPAILDARDRTNDVEHQRLVELSDRFRMHLHDDDVPVFVRDGWTRALPFPGFVYFSDLDRRIMELWPQSRAPFTEIDVLHPDGPPMLGIGPARNLEIVQAMRSDLEIVEEVDDVVIWRLPARPPPGPPEPQ